MASHFDVLQEFLDEPRGGGGMYLKIEEGEYDVRLLPDENLEYMGKPSRFFTKDIVYWYSVGDERMRKLSPKTFGEPCPLDDLEKEYPDIKTVTGNRKLFQKSDTFLFPVLLLKVNPDDPADFDIVGPRVMQCTYMLAKEIISLINSRDFKAIGDDSIADLDEGHNINIIRKGKQLDTKYTVNPWRKPVAIHEDWLDEMIDIMETLHTAQIGYDELRSDLEDFLFDGEFEFDKEEEEPEEPVIDYEEEEYEEEEPEEEEEEEEPEPPAKKRPGRKPAARKAPAKAPAKRKPGRPARKAAAPSAAKRKPGRPPAKKAAAAAAAAPAKRKPGRPPREAAAEAPAKKAPAKKAAAKKAPAKRGPKRVAASSNGAPKRRPGRPSAKDKELPQLK